MNWACAWAATSAGYLRGFHVVASKARAAAWGKARGPRGAHDSSRRSDHRDARSFARGLGGGSASQGVAATAAEPTPPSPPPSFPPFPPSFFLSSFFLSSFFLSSFEAPAAVAPESTLAPSSDPSPGIRPSHSAHANCVTASQSLILAPLPPPTFALAPPPLRTLAPPPPVMLPLKPAGAPRPALSRPAAWASSLACSDGATSAACSSTSRTRSSKTLRLLGSS